jgi:two-component system, NtrC family, sensor histidine kinase HydH
MNKASILHEGNRYSKHGKVDFIGIFEAFGSFVMHEISSLGSFEAAMTSNAADRSRWIWFIGISLAILLIEMALRFTPDALEHWIYAFHRLYYFPIICAGLMFGWAGGLAAAAICSLSYLMHSQIDSPDARNPLDRHLETLVFCLVGVLAGVLSDRERRQRTKAEHTATELSRVYRELQDNLEHVKRAARMSALGHLSAGLAHEIRNPLAGIEGAATIVGQSRENPEQQQEFLGIIQEESRRLNHLVTHFLEFARPQPPALRPTDVRALLDSVVRLVSRTAPHAGITFKQEVDSDLPLLETDAEQLRQVVLNLVLNAIQAMPEGGCITVSANTESGWVRIRVRDQGSGIPPEAVESIYDPFFTTKATGTGLGLPIAYQVVEQHGGELALEENSQYGACFTISLPIETR